MNSPNPWQVIIGGLIEWALHLVLWIVLFAFLLGIVPRLEHTAREFNFQLPVVSNGIMEASRWLANYWYVALLMWLPVIAVDGVLLFVLRQDPNRAVLRWTWSIVTFLILGGLCLVVILGVVLAYVGLLDALGR